MRNICRSGTRFLQLTVGATFLAASLAPWHAAQATPCCGQPKVEYIDSSSDGTAVVSDPKLIAGNTRAFTAPQLFRLMSVLLLGHHDSGLRSVAEGSMLDGGTGLSSGGLMDMPTGVWASYTHADYDNDFAATAYDGDRSNFVGGVDVVPNENMVIGIALGYESSDTHTGFNAGGVETDGWTVSPYFGALLGDTFSIDMSLGYSSLGVDQFRSAGATRVTSSPDAHRWFAAANLNARRHYGKLLFAGQVGLLTASERTDGFTESDGTIVASRKANLGQFRIGGDMSYSYGAWEPFGGFTYQRDYNFEKVNTAPGTTQPANDRDDVLMRLGVRYFGNQGLSASAEWNTVLSREDYDEELFNVSVRYEF